MRNTLKGKFKPRNGHKYMGDINNIVYRSSWELQLMHRLDINTRCVKWGSEEIVIPYYSIIDAKKRRYFMDFVAKYDDGRVALIEVKPYNQTIPPKNKKAKSYNDAMKTYITNVCKWNSALKLCRVKGWEFYIMSENGAMPFTKEIKLNRK